MRTRSQGSPTTFTKNSSRSLNLLAESFTTPSSNDIGLATQFLNDLHIESIIQFPPLPSVSSATPVSTNSSETQSVDEALSEDEIDPLFALALPAPFPEYTPPNFNYAAGVDGDMKIIDIPCDIMGTLVGIANSMSFIPKKFISPIRCLFATYMKQIYIPGLSEARKVMAWKKLFLLPVILFSNCKSTRLMKVTMRERINNLHNNKWDFTIDSLSLRNPVTSEVKTEDQIYARSTRLAAVGEIGRAYKNFLSDTRRIIPDIAVFENLASKYVAEGNHDLSENELNQLLNFARDEDTPKATTTSEKLGKQIHKMKKLTQSGFDHFRVEHLQTLYGYKENSPQEDEFRHLYLQIITTLMNADIPVEIQPLYRDSEAFVVPKGEDDLRPLGNTNLDRKIASAIILSNNRADILSFLKNTQFCIDRLGTEKCIHALRAAFETEDNNDHYFLDAQGAFNRSSKKRALLIAKTHFKDLYPFLFMLYGTQAKTWFFGLKEGIKDIDVREGAQQGCTLGMLLCALAFHPFIGKLHEKAGPNGQAPFFADDGNISAGYDNMLSCIDYIIEDGPTYGYILHLEKGTYLMARRGSFLTASEHKSTLIQRGINPAIIRMHPDDCAMDPDLAISPLDAAEAYGAKVLGSYIGSDEFISAKLEFELEKLSDEAAKLVLYDDLQQRYLFFRFCFCQKINHNLRTIPPRLTLPFVRGFDDLKKTILCSLIDQFSKDSIPDWLWTQSCFSTKNGGLGLQTSSHTAHAAYVASIIDCLPSTEIRCPDITRKNVDHITSLHRSISYISECTNSEPALTLDSLRALSLQRETYLLQQELSSRMEVAFCKTFADTLIDPKQLGWYTSVSNDMASRWLNVSPKHKHFTYKSNAFKVLLRYRLFLSQHGVRPGLRCDCNTTRTPPLVDSHCHHLITGCPKTGCGIKIHHAQANTFKELGNMFGIMSTREENGLFRDANGDIIPKRPDVSYHDRPGEHPIHLLDISNTSPIPILGVAANNAYNRDIAMLEGYQAEIRYTEKITTYNALANQNGHKFVPIIFETTGRMHSKSLAYIRSLMHQANNIHDKHPLCNYWLCRISCVFQHQVANAIIDKLGKLNGAGLAGSRHENRPDFISSFNHLRTN